MPKFKVGDIITSINPDYGYGSVDVVVKVGRVYLTVRRADNPNAVTFQIHAEGRSNIILHGDRSDAIERLRQLRQEYEDAKRKYHDERRDGLWELERQWDAKHPHPTDTLGACIEELRQKIEDDN